MKREICEIFPSLVMKYENAIDQNRLNDIFNYILTKESIDNHPTLNSGNGVVSSHKLNTNILKEISEDVSSCVDILEKINSLCMDYAQAFGCKNVNVRQSWFTIQQEKSILKQHMHPGSFLSGVIYVKTDEKSSDIYLENPNQLIPCLMMNALTESTKYNQDYVKFKANQGDVLIFPSWMKHGSYYTENETKYRTIISFNTMYSEWRY